MKIFKKTPAVLGEIAQLEQDERHRREDRATVSDFFNGAPPITNEEAEELGFTVNVNHLFGYKEIAEASNQMLSLYTKPTTPFAVELLSAPAGKAVEWSMKAQKAAGRVLGKLPGFRTHFQGVFGDATLHGEGIFHFTSRTFPLPRQAPLSKFLIPAKSTTDPAELTYFCREGEITLSKLAQIAKADLPGWKTANVRKLLAEYFENEVAASQTVFDPQNVEEYAYSRQENGALQERTKTAWDVYYFYQRDTDRLGEPLCLKIALKDPDGDPAAEKDERLLYDSEGYIESVESVIHPVFMDCIIGGEMKWHRVLGLGHLNYSLNQSIEMMICRAQQATIEGSMNLWRASNTASRDEIQQIMLKHNGVIPEGLTLIPNRFEPNFGGLLEMIQFFRQQGSKNSSGVTPNNGNANDQLEVQAAFEQAQTAAASGNRATLAYSYLDRMWTQVFARLCNACIQPKQDGYSIIKDFQDEMEREGIQLYYLQEFNVRVTATRVVGDGIRSREMSIAGHLSTTRMNHPPQVQGLIGRIIDGAVMDNQELAEKLNPIQSEPDVPQEMRAQSENNTMLLSRIKQEPKADDVDALHVAQHLPAMQTLVNDATHFQKGAFTPTQAEAFQLIGSHVMMHVNRLEASSANNKRDGNRVLAAEFKTQLNGLAAMGTKLEHNMQQARQADAKEVDPAAMEQLRLEAQKLEVAQHKLAITTQFKDRQMHNAEQKAAFEQTLKLEQNHREGQRHRQEMAVKDVQTALAVKESNKPEPASKS